MKNSTETFILLLFSCILIYSGYGVCGIPYDYFATTKCLKEPLKAQYNGGMISNPEFNQNIDGWAAFGKGIVEERISGGTRFIATRSRTESLDSSSQKVQLDEGKIYSFSAWVQTTEGSETVAAIFRTGSGELMRAANAIAQSGCWTMLKGGIVANFSGPVDILFEWKNTKAEVWIDNVSLQPFTKEEWRSHQLQSIEKVRKKWVKFQVSDSNKTAARSPRVSIKQNKRGFPFGCGINHRILESTDYQNWFASRFTVTTFTNEMKWYSTEMKQGHENYTIADAMVKFAKQNGISIRGHNVFWDDPKYQPDWVKNLSHKELSKAAEKRVNSVVPRYRGQLIAWDVVNENLHFNFFEDKLGKNASAVFYHKASKLDPETTMFMNEYNTTECSEDEKPSPSNYVKKIQEILSFPGNTDIKLGIGVQGRFSTDEPNVAYMRSSLDILASTGFPIWYTEVSIDKGPNQAKYLEEVLREAYSYPAVEGIVSFSGPITAGFKVMPLTDENFKNTPNGDVVDKLLNEWESGTQDVTVDNGRSFEISLFHGDYSITIEHPKKTFSTISLKVTEDAPHDTVKLQLNG